MEKIQRKDMLSLTRRMTVKRTSVTRIAGCYIDTEGEIDGTFNVSFLNLSLEDKEKNLKLAKTIPFAKTNEELKRYAFKERNGSMQQFLLRIRECGLKNDALLDIFYEKLSEVCDFQGDYGFYLFHDVFDIFNKGTDQVRTGESEQTFAYLVGAICPVSKDYEPENPVWGFLYPAFTAQGGILNGIDIYKRNGQNSFRQLSEFFLK